MRANTFGFLLVSASLSLTSLQASNYDYNLQYDGNYAAQGSTPWMSAAFSQLTPNQVQLQITTNNLVDPEYARRFLFNYDPTQNASDLLIAQVPGPPSDRLATSWSANNNAFADSTGGLFDIQIFFSNSFLIATRFTNNHISTFTITDTVGNLSATDFDFLSVPGSGGSYYVSAQINNPNAGFDFAQVTMNLPVSAPEPMTYLSLASLLVLCGCIARRKAVKVQGTL